MSKNLEELKELKELRKDFENGEVLGDLILYYLIQVLEDFEERLKTVEAELGIYTDEEILERFTMKVKEIKVGGTDPD